jgi:23S rRNA (guanosine2251-2'-O)-methyltransferase
MDESIVCGLHAVLTALHQHPERVAALWLSSERGDRRIGRVLDAARAGKIKFHRVPRARLDEMADGARHQGVVARLQVASIGRAQDLDAFVAGLVHTPLVLVLDGVQDPHNLGACLRVADGVGADAVVSPRDRAAPLTAAARRAASGAAETMPLFQVINLSRTLESLKNAGLWLYGAAQDAPEELYAIDLTGPVAVVVGGEGSGLRRLTRERCDKLIRIPMAGRVESLNVSVAAAVLLYEAVRQRRRSG